MTRARVAPGKPKGTSPCARETAGEDVVTGQAPAGLFLTMKATGASDLSAFSELWNTGIAGCRAFVRSEIEGLLRELAGEREDLPLSLKKMGMEPRDSRLGKVLGEWLEAAPGMMNEIWGGMRGLKVNGSLRLEACASLRCLPEGLEIDGDLGLNYCDALQRLPERMRIHKILQISSCPKWDGVIPPGCKIGGEIHYNFKGKRTRVFSLEEWRQKFGYGSKKDKEGKRVRQAGGNAS